MGDEGDRPLSGGFLFDRGGLEGAFHCPMQDDGNQSYLRNDDKGALQRDSLGDAESMGSALPALAMRKACPFFEEVEEGGIEIAQDLLEGLRITLCKELESGLVFEGGEFLAHGGQGESLSGGVVEVDASLPKGVPDEAPTASELSEAGFLFWRRSYSELVAALSDHVVIIAYSCLFVNVSFAATAEVCAYWESQGFCIPTHECGGLPPLHPLW